MRKFLGPYELSEEEERVLRDALSLLARRSSTSPWQPIETAPKDGTLFLAYMGEGNMEIARYRLESNEWWIDAYAPPHIEKNWMEAWMPLPEPPK